MPIQIECKPCAKKYNAPDHLAGKKVKCKHCGQPIAVPTAVAPGLDDEPEIKLREDDDDPLAAMAELEKTGHDLEPAPAKPSKLHKLITIPKVQVEVEDEVAPLSPEQEHQTANLDKKGRPRKKLKEVPKERPQRADGGGFAAKMGWPLMIVGIGSQVLPISGYQFTKLAGLGENAKYAGLAIGLLGAIFFLMARFGGLAILSAGGTIGAMLLGMKLAAKPEEPPSSNKPTVVEAKPAPAPAPTPAPAPAPAPVVAQPEPGKSGFLDNLPEAEPVMASVAPAPAAPLPPPPVVETPKEPAPTVIASPAVSDVKGLERLGKVDGLFVSNVYRTAATSPALPGFFTALHRSGQPGSVEMMTLKRYGSTDAAETHQQFMGDHMSFSAHPTILPAGDGRYARIVTFPKLACEIASLTDGSYKKSIPLNENFGTPTPLAFLDKDRLLVFWRKGTEAGVEMFDLGTLKRLRQLPLPDVEENTISVSPDGKTMACLFRQAGTFRGWGATLYNTSDFQLRKRIPLTIGDDSTARVLTACWSPESKDLAVLLELRGGHIIEQAPIDAKATTSAAFPPGTLQLDNPPPIPSMRSGRFVWHPSGVWIVKGSYVIDARSGALIGTTGVETATAAWPLNDSSALVTWGPPAEQRVAQVTLTKK